MSRVAEAPSASAVVAAAVVAVAAAAGLDPKSAVEVAEMLAAGTVPLCWLLLLSCHVSVHPDEGEALELEVVPQVVWYVLELDAQEVLKTCPPVRVLRCYICLTLGEHGIEGSCGLVKLALLLLCGLAEL